MYEKSKNLCCGCPICQSRKDGGQGMNRELYNSLLENYNNLIGNDLVATAPSNVGPSAPIKKSPHSFSDVVKYLKEDNDAVFRWDQTEARIRFDGVNLKFDRRGSVSNLIVDSDILNGVFYLEERTTRNEKIIKLVDDTFRLCEGLSITPPVVLMLNNLKEIKALISEDLK
jgi:hypothetical protein